jgi:hypothetical protein
MCQSTTLKFSVGSWEEPVIRSQDDFILQALTTWFARALISEVQSRGFCLAEVNVDASLEYVAVAPGEISGNERPDPGAFICLVTETYEIVGHVPEDEVLSILFVMQTKRALESKLLNAVEFVTRIII